MYKYNKEFSMSVAGVIICIILAFGGGGVVGWVVSPKEIKNITKIENTQSVNTIAIAANIDIEDGGVHRYITIDLDGITNIEVLTITNGETNIKARDSPVLEGWVDFSKIK